ncbi:MAG: orotidine-5'-phosphate decarboxylase [Acidimicrobiales bacterium]|jgi:orotidine-5'-phosphate decarboxylase
MGDRPSIRGFAETVASAVARSGPLCAGIDPSPALLARWGLPDSAEGLRSFGLRCIDAFAGVVPVVKPQVAFFERWGSAGIGALEAVMTAARQAGLLVIADAKRGDIGSTMEAYASAWLDPASPLAADAVTLVPYLGIGALRPALDLAAATGRGAVVVVRGSNPEGRSIQEATVSAGPGGALREALDGALSVEDALLGAIADLNRGGLAVPGTVGAVVGATLQPSQFELAGLGGVILAPGLGAQGGTVEDAARLFARCPPHSVLANVSRSLLAAGPDTGRLREAARTTSEELRLSLG